MAFGINYSSYNIQAPRGFRGTITPGVLPDVLVIEARVQNTTIVADGHLAISDDSGTITFRNCHLKGVDVRTAGGQKMIVQLWDRRYHWKFHEISGRYNFRKPDGTFDASAQLSIRSLAILCLQAAGEAGYNVSALPNDFFPEVDWDGDVAMYVLERLLTTHGYRICWNPNPDSVTIYATGGGSSLPANGDIQGLSFSVTVGDRPSSISLKGARKVFQSKLRTIAVGLDTDGSIKPIDDLSYTPTGGWTWKQGTQFDDIADQFDEASRRCALMSVFKWFQVVSQANETQVVPGYGVVSNVSRILPLDRKLNLVFNNDVTGQSYQTAFVQGVFLSENGNPPATDNTEVDEILDLDFDLDGPLGLVKFKQQVVKLDGEGGLEPAELYLTCSYNVQHPTNHQFIRYERSLALGGAPAMSGAYPITRDELVERFAAVYDEDAPATVTSISNNTAAIATEANNILFEVAQSFGDLVGKVVPYRRLQNIGVNGIITQVSWIISMATQTSQGGSNTIASEYVEFDAGVLRSGDRQRILRVRYRDTHHRGASRARLALWDRRA